MTQATTRTQVTRTATTTQQQQQRQLEQQQLEAVAASSSRQQLLQQPPSGQQVMSAGDDDRVVLTGSGLQTARVNEHAEFTIDGTSAGYGKLYTVSGKKCPPHLQLLSITTLNHNRL